MIYIGIDPGTKTGFAVWDSEKKEFRNIWTLDFWKAYETMVLYHGRRGFVDDDGSVIGITVVIEVPARFMYDRHMKEIWGHKTNYTSFMSKLRVLIKIATNYGGTIKEAELMADRIESLGFEVRRVQPSRKSGTKMKADAFEKLTGYTGRTSEHGRDAAMLVFGM